MAKGEEIPDGKLSEVSAIKYYYAQDLTIKEACVFDLMAMNNKFAEANAQAQKNKKLQLSIQDNSATITAQELLDAQTFYRSPVTKYRGLLFQWGHGNTYTVQTVFALEKKRLIRKALGDNTAHTDENITTIFNNLKDLLGRGAGNNYAREILRRPLDKSDLRSWFTNDVDTKSYNLILAVLRSFSSEVQFEEMDNDGKATSRKNNFDITLGLTYPGNIATAYGGVKKLEENQIAALNQLAVYAGLAPDRYSHEDLIDELQREYKLGK